MLHEFLDKYKKEIIQLCKKKVGADSQERPSSLILEKGLPVFYDELIGVLRRTATSTESNMASFENKIKDGDAATHGKESLRLGYTISQVVHSYGAVCQSITEYVQTKAYAITAREFQDLNLSLDCAIAEAVTEYEKARNENINDSEVERMGFLMHEMRNSLSAASAAHQMIQKGSVGSAGVTSEMLSRSHERMGRLIESAEAEIRFHGHTKPVKTLIKLSDIVNEISTDVTITGKFKDIHLKLEIDPTIHLFTDRHLLFSALSNLVNNAMKFTKKDGNVSILGKKSGGRILVEVEDECGGLREGRTEELFKPFLQAGTDKSGMGLGLSLSRRAIELGGGNLTVRNIPKKGCIFSIELPDNEAAALVNPPSKAV